MRIRIFAQLLVLFVVAFTVACGDDGPPASTCDDGDCLAPSQPFCDGDDRVQLAAIGACEDGACAYPETRTACEFGCDGGACLDGPCEGVTCDAPPSPSCSDDGLRVTYAAEGTCDPADGSCAYLRDEAPCGDGERCDDGACVRIGPCEGVTCDEAPAPRCDGDDAISYVAPGVCEAGDCVYETVVRDCAADGGACVDGACTPDPCEDVTCDTPPADFCNESGVAVTFEAEGTCDSDTGECTYARMRDNCAERDARCEDAVCIEQVVCADVICDSPPANVCEGLTAVRYDDVEPRCEEDACVYPVRRVPCGRTDQICVDGACVDGDPCADVTCDTPPAPVCDGPILRTASNPGACDGGACEYVIDETDCAADGLSCVDGACVDLCGDVSCDTVPADACEGDVAVHYEGAGFCDEGACVFDARREDCGVAGGACVDGACEYPEPCEGVTCDTPPAPICEGTTVLAFETDGVCDEGVCRYTPVRTNCAASGRFCFEGACVDDDPCDRLTCDTPPVADCDGDLRIDYLPEGTCELGVCGYPATATDCGAFGGTCEDGACVGGDPCRDVTCDEPPGATCDGTSILTFAAPGACAAGVCEWVETRTPCAEDAPSICAGNTAIVRTAHRCEFGTCFWDEAVIDCGDTGQVCVGGACLDEDPCRGVECTTPPPDGCDGDRITTWSGIGICTDGACVYDPLEGADCAATGGICLGGVCATRPPCEGVLCEECPADVCVGSVVSRALCPGTCEADACSYPRSPLVDCADFGEACVDGACAPIDACDGVTCDAPPAPTCSGDFVVTSALPARCAGGTCLWTETLENCATVAGGTCAEGACIVEDLCEGVTCPDGEPVCVLNSVRALRGLCSFGACYTEAEDVPCDDDTEFCWDGECRPIEECGETRCTDPPDPVCMGVDFDQVMTFGLPGICEGLGCGWDETITDCAVTGQTCFEGACVDFEPVAPGELFINEIQVDPAGPDADGEWFEIRNLTPRNLQVGGLVVRDDGGQSFTVPPGTLFFGGDYMVFAADGPSIETEAPVIDWGDATVFSLDNDADEIELVWDGVVIDRVAWTPIWPVLEGETIGVDPSVESPDNSDPSSWCPTGFPDGTAGVINRACPVVGAVDAGDLVITEVSPGGTAPLDWFEVTNLTPGLLDLTGVQVVTGGGTVSVPDGTRVGAGQRLVMGSTVSSAPSVDVVLVGLSLETADAVTLRLDGVDIDTVSWTADWPWTSQASMSFVGVLTGDNTAVEDWCRSWFPYDGSRTGTPGERAFDCEVPDVACEVDADCADRAPICMLETVVEWPATGSCVDSVCTYAAVDSFTDCEATGQICIAGACIDE